MAKRRDIRIKVMQILYRADLENLSIMDALGEELSQNSDIDGIDDIKKMCEGINYNLTEIDDLITKNLHKYTISRLNVVDREIIRISTYEMMQGLDPKIAINEALEITKDYSDEGNHKQVSFNNRVLNDISNMIKK